MYSSRCLEMKRSVARQIALIIVVAMASVILWHGLTAAQTSELTLEESLAQFYKNNLDIIINRYEVDKSYADYVTAKLVPNPNLSVNYNNLEISRGHTNRGDNTQLAIRVDQLIETAGKRTYRTNAANEFFEASKMMHKDVIRNLLIGFYNLFYAINLDMFNVDFARYEASSYDRLLDIAGRRHNAGFLSSVDYTKLKMRKIELSNNLVNLENQLKNDLNSFAVVLGIEGPVKPVKVKINENPRKFNEEDLMSAALENRYDLIALKRQLKASEHAVSLAKAMRIPDIGVGGEYDSTGNPARNGIGGGISIAIPIFSRAQGEILKREAEKKQVETSIMKTRKMIGLEVNQALNNYNTSVKVFDAYRENKPEMENLMKSTTKAFSLGGITVLDLLESEKAYRDFITKYNQSYIQTILNGELIKIYTGEMK